MLDRKEGVEGMCKRSTRSVSYALAMKEVDSDMADRRPPLFSFY
ncbi:MAG TPA: hypothetical protein PKU78_03375 [Candidatus Dojkabacteria bacterium]|nr:hypothetical protein [Candidatus Dojkabacteria bacterium]